MALKMWQILLNVYIGLGLGGSRTTSTLIAQLQHPKPSSTLNSLTQLP